MNGFNSKCTITIPSNKISYSVDNLPILLIADNLPTEILAESGGCQYDGRDIRFTDNTETTEFPREIVNVDKTNGKIAIYVKIPTLTASTEYSFICHWNNSNADEPGVGSASEYKLVWSDYYGVYHFTEMNSGWKGIKDSSGKWSYFTSVGTIEQGTGHADGMYCAEISPTFGMQMPETLYFTDNNKDFMFWANGNGTLPIGKWCTGTNGIPLGWLAAGQFGQGWGGFTTNSSAMSASGWHHFLIKIPTAGGTATTYVNMGSSQTGGTSSGNNFGYIGTAETTSPTHSLSEFRMTRGNNLSLDYYNQMYICESDPANFCSSGTVETSAAGYSLTLNGLQSGSEVRLYLASDNSELDGVESSSTSFTWSFEHSSDFDIHIVIHHPEYVYIRYSNFTITANSITIPIIQEENRYYLSV